MRRIFLFFIVIQIYNIDVVIAQGSYNKDIPFFEYIQQKKIQTGQINIYQSESIKSLVNKFVYIHKKQRGIKGYRIQIFSASGQQARNEAKIKRSEFVSTYPDFDYRLIYPLYQPPFFKIRVGDYRTKEEALKFYKQVVKQFPNSYIVKAIINYPKL
ncbi:MAG: SPOR domain-containing protein [Bacteroidales bacterium]|nr:SPOR domain-containing protein [Bacteroidales bacterium]